MSVEQELKFPCSDLIGLRQRLMELGASELRPRALEDNLVLDREGELLSTGRLLRLRSDGRGTRLTFKGPVRYEGKLRIRDEHETFAEDAEALRELLSGVGFEIVRRYQKYREVLEFVGVQVMLDETPIGDFAEFEGDSGEAIEKAALRCGLDPGDAERRSYLELYRDHVSADPEAPVDMVFP